MPAVPSHRAAVPTHLAAAPSLPAHVIERPTLTAHIEELVAANRVALMVAPTGFGKTAALTAWAAHTRFRVGWLSLSPLDRHSAHLRRGLSAALRELELLPDADRADWPVLVIDDAHLMDPTSAKEVLHLEHDPFPVRFLLAGRHEPHVGLTRLQAHGELGRVGSQDLAFSEAEVGRAAAALGRQLDTAQVARLHRQTQGWPVAVRLALMAGEGTASRRADEDFPQMVDYLLESMLAELPTTLARFVETASICDWLTGALAADLTGRPDSAALLEQAVELGLPLQRHEIAGRVPVYSWHPVMAQAGRALLLRRDPAAARELHLRAARLLAAADPHAAAVHALHGGDPALAAELIGQQWLAVVLRGDCDSLSELCLRLPAPFSADPVILLVRALCARNAGDEAASARLQARAMVARLGVADEKRVSFEVTWLLARLFLADTEEALAAACQEVQDLLEGGHRLEAAVRAAAAFLLGWSLLRLRRDPAAVEFLVQAASLCRAEGLDDLAERAEANHVFALAFGGDFVAARAALQASRPGGGRGTWQRSDGAVETFALGWMAFYQGDVEEAGEMLRQVAEYGGAITSYAHIARVWLVHLALDCGDRRQAAAAERNLESLPDRTLQGLPWRPYKAVAQAGVRLVEGDREGAAVLLRTALESGAFMPVTRALAAELLWDCGLVDEARQTAAALLDSDQSYVRVGALLVTALCARAAGQDPDDLVEQALSIAAAQGLARSFQRRDAALAELLAERAERGSAEEQFLAAMLATHLTRGQEAAAPAPLSSREREVLGHLATTMPAAEICRALFISANTLKTHLRSIYRKLGVDNRRDAVRVFREGRSALTG